MADPKVEEVFKISGVPTYTFVQPVEYDRLLVALRSAGRGVIIEGPSGIGKTTAVEKALEEIPGCESVMQLSARKQEDRELIAELPSMNDVGTVLIDDFHRLDDETRAKVADYLKTLADEDEAGSKIVIIGINKAGASLIQLARDLVMRIDIIKFESNPDESVERLLGQGEIALNVSLSNRDEIVKGAGGSFYIAQMLALETCVGAGFLEKQDEAVAIDLSYEVVLLRVMDRLGEAFHKIAVSFASGTRLRRSGRAPYLYILRWLAEASEWSIDIDHEANKHPELKGSVGQVVDKGHLEKVIAEDDAVGNTIHFSSDTKVLAVEDPQFVFYIRNLAWNQFAEQVGYLDVEFETRFDFALSFAGQDRELASRIFDHLTELELAVFYDQNEEHRILAENIEDYIGPIYRTEATFVVPLISEEFPKRVWTRFESDQFRDRFGDNAVIPIWFSGVTPAAFGEDRAVGGMAFDQDADLDDEASRIAQQLARKLTEHKLEKAAGSAQLALEVDGQEGIE